MSLENEISKLVSAANQLTGEVAGKLAVIDQRVEQKKIELDAWQANARGEWPFLNLLKNTHMVSTNAAGAFIDIPFVLGGGEEFAGVVTAATPNLPAGVADWFKFGLIGGRGNLAKINFRAEAGPRYWLALNALSGTFCGGFKFVYVETGRVRNINAGQVGRFFDVTIGRTWHADFTFGDVEPGTVAYFGTPFVVSGVISEVNQVRTINYAGHQLNYI